MTTPPFDGRQACSGAPLELFFPASGDASKAAIREARSICARCPVRVACHDYAMNERLYPGGPHVDGVWAGLTAKERHELRKNRRTVA